MVEFTVSWVCLFLFQGTLNSLHIVYCNQNIASNKIIVILTLFNKQINLFSDKNW